MKTNKHQTLKLVKHKGEVQARDLVDAFNYSPGTARSYLAYLSRQDLLHRPGAGHALTPKGEDRLQYFEVARCPDPACPRCQGKAGCLTCPTCGWKVPREKARLKAAWDTVFFTRKAGVYCPVCRTQIFTDAQARLVGIREE